jgi:alpha-aminoadipate carrier protein LysW
MILCPECESNIDVEEDEIDEGDVLSCDECGSEFEVVTQNPLELARISDDDEDDEDEDEDEE